ncbi:mechanosensitive ion channel family protein [Salegentibacter chungangensis]|uniref:Mechanosensitive ion channel family protein n=1 Tax=Salegentibacter chungangensis TaxID=1335724 RepID=A0ABW3NTA5_9FLAO
MKFSLHFIIIMFLAFFAQNAPVFAQEKTDEKDSLKDELPSENKLAPEHNQYIDNSLQEYNKAYYKLDRLNNPNGLAPERINLQTPQATLEHFIVSSRNKDFKDAAYALNLNLMPSNLSSKEVEDLANKLFFVLDKRINIDWDGLPDRPDGQIDIRTSTNQAVAGVPRRSIIFGETKLNNRNIVFRLQRVQYKDYGAFWLISANTVENIEELYEVYGPTLLDRTMPQWSRGKIGTVPLWKPILTIILIIISFLLGRLVIFILKKIARTYNKRWVIGLSERLGIPAGLAVAVFFFYISLNNLISYSGAFSSTIYAFLLAIVIASGTWFFMRIIDFLMKYVAENKIANAFSENNDEAKQLFTYISVARRIITFTVVIIGTAIILSQFKSLEKLGISMLASAGLATIVLGIAAQNTLGNIIAGIQIALTKPVRIGDTIIINDRWGYVEDIRFTYMVVRTWDLRRLIVPLQTVISDSFENLSITSQNQIREISLYVDYRVDVDKLRKKYEELLEASEEWDGNNPPLFQVTDMTEKSLKIRAICSAKDPNEAWNLHCKLREKLVAYINELEDGIYFSRTRIDVRSDDGIKESPK